MVGAEAEVEPGRGEMEGGREGAAMGGRAPVGAKAVAWEMGIDGVLDIKAGRGGGGR